MHIPLSKHSLESGIKQIIQNETKIHIPLSKYILESGIQKKNANENPKYT